MFKLAPWALLPAALMANVAAADVATGRWALCGAPLLAPVDGDPSRREAADTPIQIEADRGAITGRPPIYQFDGDAILTRADQTLEGEALRYDREAGRVIVEQAARLREAGLLIEGESIDYRLDAEQGRFEGVGEYRVATGHLQGSADRIIREGPIRSRYEGVTLSTCMPGDEFWQLSATTASINTNTRQGRAWNSVLSIHDLPVFYTPYLQFPIGDERMSGFLAPTIGQSDTNGTTVSLPWYWNIAPNQDATITPTSYWKRGVLLDTEYRYLQEWVDGEINASYLPDDDRFGEDRWAIDQTHDLQIGQAIRGELRQQRTSDTDFNDDFSDEFDYRSASFLESRAELAWADRGFLASVDAQYWQRVEPREESGGSSPYARRPRVQLGYDPSRGVGPFEFDIASEYTDFYNEDPTREQGVEYNVAPRVSMPITDLAYRFEPAVAWQHSGYDLTNPDPDRDDDSPSASVPIYTADAQLFLERPRTLFEGVYQTLEPRVLYRNVPDRDQDQLPNFGSGSTSGNFSRLFRPTEFSNGHTEQASVGITTRYIDDRTGQEYLEASIGQTFFYHDDAPRDRSDYITELRLALPRGLEVDADYRWDPEDSDTNKLRTILRWRGQNLTTVNLGLRREKTEGETSLSQLTASVALPITQRWQVFAGAREDLNEEQTLESFYGVQHAGCCHAIRLIVDETRLQNTDPGEPSLDQEVMVELELKGLGGIGDRIRPFLNNEIDGYNPEF